MTTITIERTILDRLIEAWDSTVLPTHRDGMMQERMEDLRAELAKPEQEETFIPNWANYRQGVADGKAGSPKWHDAPTEPGLWFNSINHYADIVSQHWIDRGVVANSHARWYGPIPQDTKAEGESA